MVKVLITGAAGFIGFNLIAKLLNEPDMSIIGLDSIDDYYDVNLKYNRLKLHGIGRNNIKVNSLIKSKIYTNYSFVQANLIDYSFITELMCFEKFDIVVNLAAQAGVRYSIQNPRAYINSNIIGFLSILEGCRQSDVKHLVYASTSSVYGLNSKMPLSEHVSAEHPVSLYAATKKSNELMAHSYSHLYGLPSTGLRFFTVYGPWGRPDMALFLFAKAIKGNKPITVFNHGKMIRDFTYIDDVIQAIRLIMQKPATQCDSWDSVNPMPNISSAPFRIFNVGNSNPVNIEEYICALEKALGKRSKRKYVDMNEADVSVTHADVKSLEDYIDFKPSTSIEDGVRNFVEWFNWYSEVDKSNFIIS